MDICTKCFDSKVISNYIKRAGYVLPSSQRCIRCNKISKYRIDDDALRFKIQRIICEIYQHEYEHGLIGSANSCADKGEDGRDILSADTYSLEDICGDFFEISGDNEKFYDFLVEGCESDSIFHYPDWDVWINISCDWTAENKINLNWDYLSDRIKSEFPDGVHVHSRFKRIKEFKCLKATFETLTFEFSTTLYRARNLHTDNQNEYNVSPVDFVGIAPNHKAKHNRFSPQGVSYGYFSKDIKTTIKEIRATKGHTVAIGVFSINHLKLIDFRRETLKNTLRDPFSPRFTPELLCSNQIIRSFLDSITKPINKDERDLEYLPTQAISMFIHTLGYDGFVYDSSLDYSGINYLLFGGKNCIYNDHIIHIVESHEEYNPESLDDPLSKWLSQ